MIRNLLNKVFKQKKSKIPSIQMEDFKSAFYQTKYYQQNQDFKFSLDFYDPLTQKCIKYKNWYIKDFFDVIEKTINQVGVINFAIEDDSKPNDYGYTSLIITLDLPDNEKALMSIVVNYDEILKHQENLDEIKRYKEHINFLRFECPEEDFKSVYLTDYGFGCSVEDFTQEEIEAVLSNPKIAPLYKAYKKL